MKNLARRDLILLHPADRAQPTGTDRWLSPREVTAHYHVRIGNVEHFGRQGRLLTGRAVGLVLSGGSSRGGAHIGVIRAMREANIPIDYVGGTSSGSVIAAQVAVGQDVETFAELHRKWWVGKGGMHKYTLPLLSLSTDRAYNAGIKDIVGLGRVEDLCTSWFAVSTNLTVGDLTVHRHGLLWEACRASGSMPAYFPPFQKDGDLLVDGGIIDNLPIGVMRGLSEGVVFASDVSSHSDAEKRESDFSEVSGWQVLLNKINPFSRSIQAPMIPEVLARTLEVGMGHHRDRGGEADFCFSPPVQNFSWFDAKEIGEIVEVGYQHAREALENWDLEGIG